MNKPIIHTYTDKSELTIEFCKYLNNKIQELSKTKNKIHIALSGGNTPKIIFELLAKEYATVIPWEKLHFYWGDDRCVPVEDSESNYGEAKRILFDHISIPQDNIHAINGENDPKIEAVNYSEVLKKNLPFENGLPCFDINILGIGDDGHTASIFPYNIELFKSFNVCEVAAHPVSGQKRITITGDTLNNAKNIVFLVAGKNKSEVFKHIYNKEKEAKNYPSNFIEAKNGILEYFMDKEAAQLVNL